MHTGGLACKQQLSFASGQFKLRGPEVPGGATGGPMLNIGESGSSYYLCTLQDISFLITC